MDGHLMFLKNEEKSQTAKNHKLSSTFSNKKICILTVFVQITATGQQYSTCQVHESHSERCVHLTHPSVVSACLSPSGHSLVVCFKKRLYLEQLPFSKARNSGTPLILTDSLFWSVRTSWFLTLHDWLKNNHAHGEHVYKKVKRLNAAHQSQLQRFIHRTALIFFISSFFN